jgi:SAM-dependent methyltransferase
VGARGRVTGIDPSRVMVSAARRLARAQGLGRRITYRVGDGARLPFRANRFDCAVAVTVLLHVPNGVEILGEMVRVARPGGIVGAQDQDMGTLVVDHPDRALTRRILDGVHARRYADPWSGRALAGHLVRLGLRRVRLLTAVYQDTGLEPFTHSLLKGRARSAVEFGLVSAAAASGWVQTLERLAASGQFTFTLNFYGAAGVKPAAGPARGPRPRATTRRGSPPPAVTRGPGRTDHATRQ